MINIYIVGTAGSGKTTFAGAIQRWMHNRGLEVVMVNLDPGAEQLSYRPDVDVRDWVKLEDIMNKYELGPNGAQILSADLIVLNVEEFREVLSSFEGPYAVIDTPGQIELFAFRYAFKMFVSAMGQRSFLTFLIDPMLARTPDGFISLFLLSASTQFRFGLPSLNVLSKVDLLDGSEVEKIIEWDRDCDALYQALLASSPSMVKESSVELFRSLESLNAFSGRIVPVSSNALSGVEDWYNAVQQVYMGGEDLTSD